ncbi:MAG TPA: S53 family peptidase [Gaiellaceae bacterium]|jgi:subtilase family serine protease
MGNHKRAAFVVVVLALAGAAVAAVALSSSSHAAALPIPQPATDTAQFVKAGTTPPTDADCEAVKPAGITCFTPQAIQSAYNLGPLYQQGLTGKGVTIAIVDSYGSDTMAHDLHVYDQAFGLKPMCGEEGVTTCTAGMPKFSELSLNGTPATKGQPGNGTHQEDKSAWAIEVALDVETSHAIAPDANILLVHTNTAETLGVQGFPNMMKAEDYVVKNHLADVISQSFGSAEEAFGSPQSLLNLRYAFQDAQANHVTVLASTGDDGTSNIQKTPVSQGGSTILHPTVGWPASDPLVTAVGGTYLCTDPNATTNQPRTPYSKPSTAAKCASNSAFNPGGIFSEVAWTFSGGGFSSIFAKPSYQNSLPAGSSFPANVTTRGIPDVAFEASSATGGLIYLSLPPDGNGSNINANSTGWYSIGGTSLSCPQWAGIVAIADQLNGKPLGFINPALYKLGTTSYASDFFDVASGNTNQEDPNVPGFPSTTGWDAVTGLGTPNAANLVPDLVAAANS